MKLNPLGCYTVGDYTTYSKLEALEVSVKTGQRFDWYFNDHVFSQYDWSIDPPGNLEFWYAERARQLRNKYGYLILMYSGGADSSNILHIFIKNNIFIDEIVTTVVLSETSNSQHSEVNHEVTVTALPKLKSLVENNPTYAHTKLTVIDGGPWLANGGLNDFNGKDYWYNQSNYYFNPWGRINANIWDIYPRFRALSEQYHTALIYGVDKPIVRIREGKFYATFCDAMPSGIYAVSRMFKADPTENVECFYWTPDLPLLAIKQAHTVLNYVKNVSPNLIDDHLLKAWDPLSPKPQNGINQNGYLKWQHEDRGYHLTQHGLDKLIYPGWDTSTIVTPKPTSAVFGSKDTWLWYSNVEKAIPQWYGMGVVWLRQHVKSLDPNAWFEFPYDPTKSRYSGGLSLTFKNYALGY